MEIKQKAGHYFLKGKRLYEENKRTIKAGQVMGLGLILIVFAVMLFLGNKDVKTRLGLQQPTTYAEVAATPTDGMATVKSEFKYLKPFTLVLYRTGCSACEKAEKPLVKDYLKYRDIAKHDFIMLDVTKLSKKDQKYLLEKIPSIGINGKIPTPLVANIVPVSENSGAVDEISSDNATKSFDRVFKKSPDLKGA